MRTWQEIEDDKRAQESMAKGYAAVNTRTEAENEMDRRGTVIETLEKQFAEFAERSTSDVQYWKSKAEAAEAEISATHHEASCCDDIKLDQPLAGIISDLQKARQAAEARVEALTAERDAALVARAKWKTQAEDYNTAIEELEAENEALTEAQEQCKLVNGNLAQALVQALADERARVGALTEAHEHIVKWSDAYPLGTWPEPDLKKARALLKAGGVSLDAISASAMRRVVEGIGKISRDALGRST